MDPYIRDLLASPVLDAADERALAVRCRAGDPEARHELITRSRRLVALQALRRGLRGEELRDAVQAGSIGLIAAVDRFDPDRGARLGTYAWHWIGASLDAPGADVGPVVDRSLTTAEPAVSDLQGLVTEGLDDLPEIEAQIVRMRFGVDVPDGRSASRREVAETLGLTVAQVRRHEGKAMRQLRGRLAKVVHRAPPRGGADPL